MTTKNIYVRVRSKCVSSLRTCVQFFFYYISDLRYACAVLHRQNQRGTVIFCCFSFAVSVEKNIGCKSVTSSAVDKQLIIYLFSYLDNVDKSNCKCFSEEPVEERSLRRNEVWPTKMLRHLTRVQRHADLLRQRSAAQFANSSRKEVSCTIYARRLRLGA